MPQICAAGKRIARGYLDSFYGAIESDDAFYRPVVASPGTKMYATPNGAAACGSRSVIPVGTPVGEPLHTDGAFVHVMVLDALWNWAPPVKCPAVRQGPVWIEAAAISKDFPKK